MTKKKIIIYTIIFLISTALSIWYKYAVAHNTAQNFNEACKMVINTTCQQYIIKISNEKKFEEAITIQKVRIKENEKLLKYYKRKISNKKLLKMNYEELTKSFNNDINTPKGKNDYYLLKTAEFTTMEIIIDAIAVAQIEYKEFNNHNEAIKILKKAKRIAQKNPYITNNNKIIEELSKKISTITILPE